MGDSKGRQVRGRERTPIAFGVSSEPARSASPNGKRASTSYSRKSGATRTSFEAPNILVELLEPDGLSSSAIRRRWRTAGTDPRGYLRSAERDGTKWRIAVRDQGIGVDPDQPGRSSDVFQRLHSHDEHTGTGIGLALGERIIERHDGDTLVRVRAWPGVDVLVHAAVRQGYRRLTRDARHPCSEVTCPRTAARRRAGPRAPAVSPPPSRLVDR